MSWDDINDKSPKAKEQRNAARERQAELVKAYARCFNTDDGQRVIEDLTRRFLIDNSTALEANNVNYEAAYHNGEAGVIRMLIHYIQQAESL